MRKQNTIFTIGHSTRTIEELLAILKHYEITMVVDVRTIPRSRHNPQFNEDVLKAFLEKHDIGYLHMSALGGLRHPLKNSINNGWHNASFRGFADYMQTAKFKRGVEVLCDIALKNRTVIMCAEAIPWRCHRSLIADALLVRHFVVHDIYSGNRTQEHTLTSFAQVKGLQITYPGE